METPAATSTCAHLLRCTHRCGGRSRKLREAGRTCRALLPGTGLCASGFRGALSTDGHAPSLPPREARITGWSYKAGNQSTGKFGDFPKGTQL